MPRKVRFSFFMLSAIVLAAFVLSAAAQQRPGPATGPDRKAYTDAMAIKEPDKKIEALQQVLKDFPDSPSANTVQQAIFDALVKNFPDQKTRIIEQANLILAKATDVQKPYIYGTLGTQLCNAGILLDEAESYATRSLALVEQELARLKANPPPPAPNTRENTNQRPAPNPAASLTRTRTASQLTLGRIYLRQGKLNAAEKNLKRALTENPQLTAATLAMAEVYEKRGDNQKALASYITAASSSKIPVTARQALNALYAKAHNGSSSGLEEVLDAKYLELNPKPFEVERYHPTPARTQRVVLAEVFTGSGCPPCVAADLAADLAMGRYDRKELAVIMYHEHIPQPDPMTTPQTMARFKFYAGKGVPTLAIDGVTTGGGGARSQTKNVYDRITKEIEKKLEIAAEAELKLEAKLSGNTVKANCVVDKVTSDSPDLRLHIVLVEGKLRYTGENGVRFHPMVVRSMAGDDGTGIALNSKGPQNYSWEFDLNNISAAIKQHLDDYEAGGHRGNTFTFTDKKSAIDPRDLSVAAFVQDAKSRAVLQAVILKINP